MPEVFDSRTASKSDRQGLAAQAVAILKLHAQTRTGFEMAHGPHLEVDREIASVKSLLQRHAQIS